MTATSTPAKPGGRGRIIFIVIAVILAIFYALGLMLFHNDAGADTFDLKAKGETSENHLIMHVKVASIDPAKETAVLAITPEPAGDLTDDKGYSAKSDVTFTIYTDDGPKEVKIKAGDHMTTTSVPVTAEGEISEYPLDKYAGDIEIDSETPMVIDAESHVQAYTTDMDLSDESKPTELTINYEFSRSHSIIIFACFVLGLIALVALLALTVALGVAMRGFKFEFGMIGWVGALLFVLPAIRNALPGQPPIGTVGDFAVFFWAEIIAIVSLVTLVVTWYRRASA